MMKPIHQGGTQICIRNTRIWMDVLIGDDQGTIYDLEMQNTWKEALPKRARYYQSVINLHGAVKKLRKGIV